MSTRILILVLEDGETYSDLHGVRVIAVTPAELEAIEHGEKIKNVVNLQEHPLLTTLLRGQQG